MKIVSWSALAKLDFPKSLFFDGENLDLLGLYSSALFPEILGLLASFVPECCH
jgi:hypothetical protein